MKIAATIARYLLAVMFIVFGLNGFLSFLPMPPVSGLGGQFFAVAYGSHYMVIVFLIQLLCGLMFLVNRYIPLALTLIAPVIVNILNFHLLMNPGGIAPGLLATICWFLVFYSVRSAFSGILSARSQ